MSKEIEAKVRVEDIEHDGKIELGEWGLEIKETLTKKDWLDAVLSLQKFNGKVQWYLGDLVAWATGDFIGWDKKNDDGDDSRTTYEKLVDATGYDYQTLRQYASVARRFPNVWREEFLKNVDARLHLSFSHFRVVAPLEDNFAVYWLKKAADNGWGAKKLAEVLRKEYGEDVVKEEKPIGYITFKEQQDNFFKGYFPNLSQEKYDEKTWLLEIHDVTRDRLSKLGIEV